ncbi:cytochrome b-c1 complex subunit 8 [Xylariomycetidae sp. FL2044]|nr:cytochrome b-c1 complex subunit 8 [Xylariomycetidae sp. FL2044]
MLATPMAFVISISTLLIRIPQHVAGSGTQRGIILFTLSANRQKPLAGAYHDAVFNTWRRTRAQILYWLPPLAAAYYAMNWAIERNEYLNSKKGRKEAGGA